VQPELRRKKSANVARARMFIKKDLGWLPGYPLGLDGDGLQWRSQPALGTSGTPTTITLEREDLRRASLTRSKLVRRFSRALPKAVANIEAWTANTSVILDLVKAAVHTGEPPRCSPVHMDGVYPRSLQRQASEARRAHPELDRLVVALGWLHLLDPPRLGPELTALADLAGPLHGLMQQRPGQQGLDDALALVRLAAADGLQRLLPMATLLSQATSWRAPLRGATERISKLRSSLKQNSYNRERLICIPWGGSTCMGPPLVQLLHALHDQRQRSRRQALALLELVLPIDIAQRWSAWWERFEATRPRRPPDLSGWGRAHLAIEWDQQQDESLQSLEDSLPPEVGAKDLAALLARVGQPGNGLFWGELAHTLSWLPREHDRKLIRLAFLGHWADLAKDEGHEHTRSLLREVRRYMGEPCANLESLRPWSDILEGAGRGRLYNHWTFDSSLLSDLPSRHQHKVALEVMRAASIARPGCVDAKVAELLPPLVEALVDADLITRRLLALMDAGQTDALSSDLVALADRIAEGDDDFPDLIAVLEPSSLPQVDWAVARLQEADEGALLRRHLSEHGARRLARIGTWGRILERSGGIAPPVPRASVSAPPAWVQRWPATLRRDIAALAAVDDDAEYRLPHLLSRWLRSGEALEDEIAAIGARLERAPAERRGRLETRLRNLERRRHQPSELKPGQLAKARARLQRARESHLLDAWEQALTRDLDHDLPGVLGLTSAPPWMRGPDVLTLIPSILDLKPPFSELGLDILRRRGGVPPWDHRHAPANAAFLEQLEHRGIDLGAWLDHPPTHEHTLGDTPVSIAITRDPLDVLRMGAPFDTCLAPGSFNFFSAVANAVDINKRLLCAWDAKGAMIARCLLALTDQGGLLTFHAYANQAQAQFAELAATYVDDLVLLMNTVVVSRGEVRSLVAPEWYDDGPRQLPASNSALHEGSELRKALPRLEPAELVPAMEAALAPRGLDALTLPSVAHLPEIRERPELARELVPVLRRVPESQGSCMVPICQQAMKSAEPDDARQLLRERAMTVALDHHRRHQELPFELLELLVQVDPAQIIAILRRARPRGRRRMVRQRPIRRLLRGLAEEALGRETKARESFQAVMDDDWATMHHRGWAERRLRELDGGGKR
jgi:hypothetical protein